MVVPPLRELSEDFDTQVLTPIYHESSTRFYYIRLVHISYFEKIQNRLIFERVPKINGWILAITFFFILFLFVSPGATGRSTSITRSLLQLIEIRDHITDRHA